MHYIPRWEEVESQRIIIDRIPVRFQITGIVRKGQSGKIVVDPNDDSFYNKDSEYLQELPLTAVLGKKVRITVEVIA